jgi:hypothetical protein
LGLQVVINSRSGMAVSKQKRFSCWKLSKERKPSLAFILLLTTSLFFIPDSSHASDPHRQVHGRGQPNSAASYQQQPAFQQANTMQRTVSGFEMRQMQQESFTRQIKTQIEAIPRKSGRPQPDLRHPKGKPTELQKESIEKQQEAQVKAIPRKSGRSQPDLRHPKGELTELQKESIRKQQEAQVKASQER